jgi:hypothetical protein
VNLIQPDGSMLGVVRGALGVLGVVLGVARGGRGV